MVQTPNPLTQGACTRCNRHRATAVSSAYDERRTMGMTAVNNAADGRRTSTFHHKTRNNSMGRKLQTAAIKEILRHRSKMYKIKIPLNKYIKDTHSGG